MSTKNKTVLVVDDDIDMLKLIERILTGAGLKVITAQSPADARKHLSSEPPHLIMSDLQMEPESGFSFIQSIRAQKQFDQIPLLVLSSLNDFASVKKAAALGINDYVIKPLQAPMLLRKIRKALFHTEFAKWTPPDGKEYVLEGEIESFVSALGETGYAVAGPFKLRPGTQVTIQCTEFTNLGLTTFIHKVAPIPNVYQAGGKFINQVTFIGVGENDAVKIRKFLNQRNS